MAQSTGIGRATRRIQRLTEELELLGDNPMLDPETSQRRHKAIWDEINHLNIFVQENKQVRRAPRSAGGGKRGQRTFAV